MLRQIPAGRREERERGKSRKVLVEVQQQMAVVGREKLVIKKSVSMGFSILRASIIDYEYTFIW